MQVAHTAFSQTVLHLSKLPQVLKETHDEIAHQGVYVTESGQWLTFAFVCWIGSQRIAEKPFFAPVTVEASSVIDALQTFSRQAVAVANSIGVYVVVTLTWTAQSHRPIAAQRVSKVAVITELTSLAWE